MVRGCLVMQEYQLQVEDRQRASVVESNAEAVEDHAQAVEHKSGCAVAYAKTASATSQESSPR
eukprot:1928425-Alexandrium_andersonii.AAC.1